LFPAGDEGADMTRVPAGEAAGSSVPDVPVYSVWEITREVKLLLETGLAPVWVTGEISNFTHHSSGHMYFSLKDERSQLRCVMFRAFNRRLSFTPADGQKVMAFGKITVYEPRGEYQLNVQEMKPAGLGELMLALEALKAKLAKEGLFDRERKKPVPAFPGSVGVVTSPTGAAIRDIIKVIRKRFPGLNLILAPSKVQGEGAAVDIVRGIEMLNRYGKVDLIIVGRGGGSVEDLWAFNEEPVVRAIAASGIPIVSAVGHEIDYTLSDFAADLRAPTPSAAAELITPDQQEIRRRLESLMVRMGQAVARETGKRRERLAEMAGRYGLRRPLDIVYRERQRLDDMARSLGQAVTVRMRMAREVLGGWEGRLNSLDPQRVLARGYSITRMSQSKQVVRSSDQLGIGSRVNITFGRGWAEADVTETGTA